MERQKLTERNQAPEGITNAEFGASLRLVANMVMRTDGDRDYMNPSDLNVQQTTSIADFLRSAADRFEVVDCIPEFEAQAERLRAALKRIADLSDSEAGEPLDDAIRIATQALKQNAAKN
jgi:CRISPR/Cas system CMR-associated protein Cmr3 (group 5 of RAMP superfamily)